MPRDPGTRAGAGGMILTEAARGATTHEEVSDMDPTEVKKLQESVAGLRRRAIMGDAREMARTILASVTLPKRQISKCLQIIKLIFS